MAQVWVSGSHITQGTVKLNDTYFASPTYNTTAWRNLVSCQEVGHTLGLDHQDETFDNPNLGTCMDYTSDPTACGLYGPSNEQPNGHDYDQLVTIYSHLDNVSTVGSFAAVSGQDSANEPENWGQLIRSSRNGRVQIYELDLGRGRRIFTHVFWADPDATAGSSRRPSEGAGRRGVRAPLDPRDYLAAKSCRRGTARGSRRTNSGTHRSGRGPHRQLRADPERLPRSSCRPLSHPPPGPLGVVDDEAPVHSSVAFRALLR